MFREKTMSLFRSNRDFDSTLIIVGIHALMGWVLWMEYAGSNAEDLSSTLNNLLIIYGMIASYFFKSQKEQQNNGNGGEK